MAGMMIINILFMCQIFVIIDSTNNTTKLPILGNINNEEPVIEISNRIIGGEAANIKSYPFAVSVQWRLGSKHHCGGTYIVPRFILSAAHCMIRYNGVRWLPENPRFYLILAGSSNLWYSPTWQIAVTDAVFPHPGFSYGTMAHDIGLYRIPKPFRITPYVNFAPIPDEINNSIYLKSNITCAVVGWGRTSESSSMTSDILQHVRVPLIATNECGRFFTNNLHSSQICAGRKEGGLDACQGDSGGPLICNNLQVGIVSWGHGCGAKNSPGVYCRVDQYIVWMKRTMMKNEARSNNIFNHQLTAFVISVITFSY